MLAHAMLANAVGPEFAVSEQEALQLAQAYVNWRKHYPGVLDPKTQALLSLILVAGTIEGPRMLRVTKRRATERATRKAAAPVRAGVSNPAAPAGIYTPPTSPNVVTMPGL